MQAASDIFLGWQTVAGIDGHRRDFYVRQLRDWKGSLEIEEMVPAQLRAYGATVHQVPGSREDTARAAVRPGRTAR